MAKLLDRRQSIASGERGQAFVVVALLLAVFGGMAAIAVDFGSMATDRRDLQNAADAIALAAAQELPDEAAAQVTAESWATKNDIALSEMELTFVAQSVNEPNPKVIVELTQDHEFIFARLIGVTNAEVGASAASIKTSPAGGEGVVPLSVTEPALEGVVYGDPVVLKYDATEILTGNTAPIRIDDPGSGNCTSSDNYCAGVKYGSQATVCAEGTDDTYCTGASVVDTEPGNKVGATRNAVNWRIANTAVECDEFDEVFEDDPTTAEVGVYSLVPECNPFLPGGYLSNRVIVIPVIEALCNGSCEVTIVGFALFFLEGFENPGSCTGNECEVIGRFARVEQNIGLLAGTFDADSELQFVRLVS